MISEHTDQGIRTAIIEGNLEYLKAVPVSDISVDHLELAALHGKKNYDYFLVVDRMVLEIFEKLRFGGKEEFEVSRLTDHGELFKAMQQILKKVIEKGDLQMVNQFIAHGANPTPCMLNECKNPEVREFVQNEITERMQCEFDD